MVDLKMFKTPKYQSFNFPCGEKHVRVQELNSYRNNFDRECVDIVFDFKNNEDIIELLLLANAVKEMECSVNRLYIKYIPFSRQDRVCSPGDSFSLRVMIDLINSIGALEVIAVDPHSEVCNKIVNLKIVEQHAIFTPYVFSRDINSYVFVSPDKGARVKTKKFAKHVGQTNLIYCTKVRDPETGKLSGFEVHDWKEDYVGKDLIIVDDICDGGGTFIGIAHELEKLSPGSKTILMVTHGFFTKGLEVFDGIIDEIYTMNGKVL